MYCVATGRYACHNKYYGRSLDDSGFRAAIVEYLTGGGGGELRLEDLKSYLYFLTPNVILGCTVTAYHCNRILCHQCLGSTCLTGWWSGSRS